MTSSSQSQALTRTYRPSSAVLSKTTRQMVPPFVQKLYELVNAPSTDALIQWSDAGDSFFVFEHERFANEVLPRFFKHRNFSSFVRQLNMYGFHKIPHLQQGVLKSDTETEFWNFEHPNFHRGQPDLLCLVTRKNSKGGSQQSADLVESDVPLQGHGGAQLLDVNSIVNGITAIKRHQQAISADLNELKTSNQHLWQEALASRERYKSQQDTINRILKFLASVFGRASGHDGSDDGHGASTPLVVRRNQRLLIGNGPENNKHKGVEVVEVEDDDNKSVTDTILTDEQPSTPLPFAQIDASSVKSSSVSSSPLFGPPSPSLSSGTTQPHHRTSGTLMAPTWASAPPNHTIPMPTPTPSTTNHSALESHRPQPAAYNTSSPSPPPTQDQIMQAAFQQLLQSPSQVQRLMQLLSSGSTNGSTPISAPITSPAQSGLLWTPPPAPLDLPQLSQVALYDNGIGGVGNNVLTFDNNNNNKDAIGLSADDQASLESSYRDPSEIEAEVDVLQANINALIENMGLDSAALAIDSANDPSSSPPSSTHPPPPAPSEAVAMMPPAQTSSAADFDFEAFLTAFANAQEGEGGVAVVDDRMSTSSGSACSAAPGTATGANAANVFSEQQHQQLPPPPPPPPPPPSVVAGNKRTSDVAELGLALPEPSKTTMPPRAVVAAARIDTNAGEPPRAKRNKK